MTTHADPTQSATEQPQHVSVSPWLMAAAGQLYVTLLDVSHAYHRADGHWQPLAECQEYRCAASRRVLALARGEGVAR